jgi:DNA end-binding protein Ku
VPAMRGYWKGYLKLSFVSCPITLYPASSASERLSFRQINRRTGHRVKHKLVDSITGEAVDSANKARGYEVGENQFLLVEDRDIEQARSERPPPQMTRTIEIERFLPTGQIDARYFEKPYYIVPREEIGQESFAVIRDAMTREGVVGLARIVLSSRERPLLVEPMRRGLRGVTLRFAHEVRGEEDYFSKIPQMKLPAEMVKLAQHIIRTKSGDFDPSMLEDHYRSALVKILRKKRAKPVAHHAPAVKPSHDNVVNLMEALRRSIAAERPAKPAARRGLDKSAATKRRTRHRSAG